MARTQTRGRTQAKRRSLYTTCSVSSTFPDAIYWDYDTLQSVTETFIRSTIIRLGLPSAHPQVPLSLWVLPDELPGGFKKPNYYLLSLLAIWGSPWKKLKLSGIYDAIDERYPTLKEKRPAYKRSLRHKLSLEPVFVNIKKTPDEQRSAPLDAETRGNDWVIDISRIDFPKRGRVPGNAGRSLHNSPIHLSEVYSYNYPSTEVIYFPEYLYSSTTAYEGSSFESMEYNGSYGLQL